MIHPILFLHISHTVSIFHGRKYSKKETIMHNSLYQFMTSKSATNDWTYCLPINKWECISIIPTYCGKRLYTMDHLTKGKVYKEHEPMLHYSTPRNLIVIIDDRGKPKTFPKSNFIKVDMSVCIDVCDE